MVQQRKMSESTSSSATATNPERVVSKPVMVRHIVKEDKHNPFLMISDFPFRSQSCFLIYTRNDSVASTSDTSVKATTNNSFKLVSNDLKDKDCEGFSDVESDKNSHFLAYEDKAGKKMEKELSRLVL